MKNIYEENVMNEPAEERKPECMKRRIGPNALCWTLVCTVLLIIGAVVLTALFCKLDLLVTVMLGGLGLMNITIGIVGIIFGIVNPNNIMGD